MGPKNLLRVVFIYYSIIGYSVYAHKAADLIVFSYHRPLQLHATLASVQKYFSNLNQIYVIYRCDTKEYRNAYRELKRLFPRIIFLRQGTHPAGDFKPLVLQCLSASDAEYVLFGVDDDVVTGYVDLAGCIEAMEISDAYAFYLRLGANIVQQYGQNLKLELPSCEEMWQNIFKFQFKDGEGLWCYPHNVDMTVFKKIDIQQFFRRAEYSSPNTLESKWAGTADFNKYGLFFLKAKMFSLILNTVQKDFAIAQTDLLSSAELLAKWNEGLIMDIDQFFDVNNESTHMAYQPLFKART